MTLPEIALTEPTGAGGGPLLVLGHSLGTGPLIWEKVVPLLTDRYRVTLLTLPGHGAAAVPGDAFTLEELADATAARVSDLNRGGGALYAGVSIGGALALMLGLRHPDVFAGVASIASAASLGGSQHWGDRAALVREQSTSVLVASSSKAWFVPESFVREPELTGRILRVLQDTSDEGYARCAEALGSFDLRDALGKIRVPVLAIGGASDVIAPEERQDEIVANVPNAQKVLIAGAAHQPPAEQPAAVAAALLDFFGGIAS